jgi:outer membrane lipoprotein-sorting protein
MKNLAFIFPLALMCSLLHRAAPQQKPADPANLNALEAVLRKMDATAASFRTAQAEFEWDTYQKVIDEVDDVETGTIYYRRAGKDIEMMAEVKKAGASAAEMKPEPKFVLFSGGKISMYQPKLDQVTEYDLGKNKADFESYLVLGFGGSGQDLMKTFDVTYVGTETIGGVTAAKLQLVPKSPRVRNNFKQILLWIDLDKGIAVQQQFFDPQDDYHLTKYSSIQMKDKIPDSVFRLKTTSKTKILSSGG